MAYSAQELIRLLSLQPHPEGGWFAFRESSGTSVPVPGFSGERETCSYIYYLLQKGEISRWHRLQAGTARLPRRSGRFPWVPGWRPESSFRCWPLPASGRLPG